MPMPTPNKQNESKDEWMKRCMGDSVMNEEFPDEGQRYAICNSKWEEENSMEDYERRFVPTEDIRLKERGDKNTLLGLGVVYNQWSEDLGGFKEMIVPGAGVKSISANDIFSTYNHNDDYVLGRMSAETLKLSWDESGIRYEVDLPDTSFGNDLKVSVGRGDVRGSSFRFRVTDDEWGVEDNKEWRKVRDFELFELGPVTNPAYPQTTADVRSVLYKMGVDYEALYRAVLRSQTDNQEERDKEIIASAIEALEKYLPSDPVEPGGVEVDETVEPILRLRLRMLGI